MFCFGPGRNRLWEVMSLYGSPEAAYNALSSLNVSDLEKARLLTPEEIKNLRHTHKEQTDELMERCRADGTDIVCYGDENYPELLYSIYSPPSVLFCKGRTEVLKNEYTVGVVGARKSSQYGRKVAAAIGAGLADAGFTVVSGFAEGTDITAQLAAVRNGGKTIAVLGSGVDYNYPPANAQFRGEIMQNGVFVSEYPPAAAAGYGQFIARNRILSGLSLCVAVIEAAEKSGTFNTVSHAVSQGREVFAVPPHDIFDEHFLGNTALLRDGAIPLFSVSDIANEYFNNIRHRSNVTTSEEVILDDESTRVRRTSRPAAPKQEDIKAEPVSHNVEPNGLDETEQIIYNILKTHGTVPADDVAAEAGMEISDVLDVLTNLEMDGIVSSSDGHSYKLT